MKLSTALVGGVLRWGLPAGALAGLVVALVADKPLLSTLAISLPVFGVLGLGIGLGWWARANTRSERRAVEPSARADAAGRQG